MHGAVLEKVSDDLCVTISKIGKFEICTCAHILRENLYL
jgi:hypothetical protein